MRSRFPQMRESGRNVILRYGFSITERDFLYWSERSGFRRKIALTSNQPRSTGQPEHANTCSDQQLCEPSPCVIGQPEHSKRTQVSDQRLSNRTERSR